MGKYWVLTEMWIVSKIPLPLKKEEVNNPILTTKK
jgi:hypothetical protein